MMKTILITAAVISAAAVLILLLFTDAFVGHQEEIPDRITDGYKKDTSDNDAPKSVESTKIVSFSLEFSTEAWYDESELPGGIYKLTVSDGMGKYEFRSRYGDGEKYEIAADDTFMQALDETVKRHDVAKHNGKRIFVSGLPDMYGENISVLYLSGEEISASDNQDGFLTRDFLYEICGLFNKQRIN